VDPTFFYFENGVKIKMNVFNYDHILKRRTKSRKLEISDDDDDDIL